MSEADMRTNADILDRLRAYTYAELARAATGRRARIDRGEIPSQSPGCGWTLRAWWDKDPIRNQIDQDIDAYHAGSSEPLDEKRGGVSPIGSLNFSKFARRPLPAGAKGSLMVQADTLQDLTSPLSGALQAGVAEP